MVEAGRKQCLIHILTSGRTTVPRISQHLGSRSSSVGTIMAQPKFQSYLCQLVSLALVASASWLGVEIFWSRRGLYLHLSHPTGEKDV